MKVLSTYYICNEKYCKNVYSTQKGSVDEPICPNCGCHFFTRLKDIEIDLGEVEVNGQVQVEQEGLTQSCCNDELRTA